MLHSPRRDTSLWFPTDVYRAVHTNVANDTYVITFTRDQHFGLLSIVHQGNGEERNGRAAIYVRLASLLLRIRGTSSVTSIYFAWESDSCFGETVERADLREISSLRKLLNTSLIHNDLTH